MGGPPGWRPPSADEYLTSAKLDYAISSGDHQYLSLDAGPERISEWADFWCHGKTGAPRDDKCPIGFSPLTGSYGYDGVSFGVNEGGIRHVSDGASNTYLIGEKYLNPQHYETNLDRGDNRAWCTGFDVNAFRTGFATPLQDTHGLQDFWRFGSAHSAGIHMAFCDGSVRVVEYGVDQFVHRAGANRHDGSAHGLGHTEPIPEPDPF